MTFVRAASLFGTVFGVGMLVSWACAGTTDVFLWVGGAIVFVSALLWVGSRRVA